MAGSQIDALEPVRSLGIGKRYEAIACPHFVTRFIVGGGDFPVDFSQLRGFKFAAECSVAYLLLNPLPGKPIFNPVAQFAAGFAQTPDDRGWIQSRRLATILRPLNEFVT